MAAGPQARRPGRPGRQPHRRHRPHRFSAWAVGFLHDDTAFSPLAARWDSDGWRTMPVQPVAGSARLDGVASLSDQDVWAVGSTTAGDHGSTLIQHWDGRRFVAQASPDLDGAAYSTLVGVAAHTSRDVWAVGSAQALDLSWIRPLIEHWDGHLWSQPAVPITPGDPADDIQLHGMAAADHGTLWAVGYRIGANTVQPLILRWDGHDWNATAAPPAPPGTRNPELNSVATAPDNGPAWAVGSATDSSTGKLRPFIAAHP